jgi:hypothetical protein
VATSWVPWTGIAVSGEKRIFVNYPRWRSGLAGSVAEIQSSGVTRWYPSDRWNAWTGDDADNPRAFVCVQSVYVDDENFLWVLDSGNPFLQGVRPGGPKLVKIDLAADTVFRVYDFPGMTLDAQRYLNDVRVDTRNTTAYLSESGLGAIGVVDLTTGASRFVLDRHASTTAGDITVIVEGRTVGSRIHCDGIALTRARDYLYFKALTGRDLYRIETRFLRDSSLPAAELEAHVEFVKDVGVCDGMEFGSDGSLYLTSLEGNAIQRLMPGDSLVTLVQDVRIKWPDSIAITDDNVLYFTTSQIHLGMAPVDPYRVFRIPL